MPTMPLPIALDAMGGDRAPRVEVEAAVQVARERGVPIVLVGDEALLREELDRLGAGRLGGLTIRHASQVIGMADAPAAAVRRKADSSMRVAFDLARAGEAAAVVSAGNSGAMLACGLLVWRRLPGVERPALVADLPTLSASGERGRIALLDVGANVDPRPSALAQFAVLGSVYARILFERPVPRVGLLSNGGEETKGTELTRAAHDILSRAGRGGAKGFDYVGYAEGRDLYAGAFDVVATDGFTGNVVLKTSEGAADAIRRMLKAEVKRSALGMVGGLLLRPALGALRRRIDWTETGGAPLLGVDGVAVVAHGSSSARALYNAIRMAARFAEAGLAAALARAIEENATLWSEAREDAVARDAEAAPAERGKDGGA